MAEANWQDAELTSEEKIASLILAPPWRKRRQALEGLHFKRSGSRCGRGRRWKTYRAVYTVKFAGVVYVLHAFQKKSKIGIKTPPEEIEKVKSRLREAEKDYAEWTEQQKRKDQDDY